MSQAVISDSHLEFQCCICSENVRTQLTKLSREMPSCPTCGSTVRMRAMIALLSRGLFGRIIPIRDFPLAPEIVGLGLSDWIGYAAPLAKRLGYTNTYFHKEPNLDITDVPDRLVGSCDFVISTDVFEHVQRPVSKAFEGARRLLKPGGLFVFSVPFTLEGDTTVEHFPPLHDWSVRQAGGEWELIDQGFDGRVNRYGNLVFHGGDGATLEMRVFSLKSMLAEFEAAGFRDVRVETDPILEAGVYWPQPWSVPVTARA